MSHANARFTPAGRLLIVERIEAGMPQAHVAKQIAAALIGGVEPIEAVAQAQALDLHPDVRAALDVAADTPATSLSTTGYVIDSLRCAAWAIQPPDALEDVLVALANRGCDADTTGAIAGGLLGITHGEAGIPPRWKDRLEYAPQLREAATRDSDNPLPRLTAAMVNHGLRRYATKGAYVREYRK